jgi:heavy metal-binding protein
MRQRGSYFLRQNNPAGRNRRECLKMLAFFRVFTFQNDQKTPADWTCPMDRDVHLDHPGKCPRCGMTLILKVPDLVECSLSLAIEPRVIQPNEEARLIFRVSDQNGNPVRRFETVHEKLMHLFVVSSDLEFFAHVHPEYQDDGSFVLNMRLPKPGMYRLLADYYPAGSVPQLTSETFYVKGSTRSAHLTPSLAPQQGENLTAALQLEPQEVMAGLEAHLLYTLTPGQGLEKYLGAWGHMLIASEDSIDLMHLHPVFAAGATVQYNVIFPRAGIYKVWSQFQRLGVVNTISFSVKTGEL